MTRLEESSFTKHNIMKIKRFYLSLAVLMSVMSASAGEILTKKESARWADGLVGALIQNFWGASFKETPDRYYFNKKSDQADLGTGDYWPQAHAMDVVIDAYLRTGSAGYRDLFDKWHEGIKKKAGLRLMLST